MTTFNMSEDFQNDLRQKLEDLSESQHLDNAPWNEWEDGFITDMVAKLGQRSISVSEKQLEKIYALWEKL